MTLDLASFHNACSPNGSLVGENEAERYYIDLSSVRGSTLIENFKQAIAVSSDQPTCQLLAAHMGSWKSQELQRLKATLEAEGWHVVYCQSSRDMDLGDVDILDVLLMLTRQVSASLEDLGIKLKSRYFAILFKEINWILQFPVEVSAEGELSAEISKLTTNIKDSPQLRFQLRVYLESRTEWVLNAINEELLGTATEELKRRDKKGLVVIVDELDSVASRRLPSGRVQPESLFIEQGTQLRCLNCHMVYTIPLALIFSNHYEALKNCLGGRVPPKLLPMVPVRRRDGSECEEGMALLRQIVLVRAFPDVEPEQRLGLITEVFDSPETLDRLCCISGGNVRHLLAILYKWFWEEEPPFLRSSLEKLITEYRNSLVSAVDEHEWELLCQVQESKQVGTDEEYRILIRGMFVYEYHDNFGSWFDLNPALIETEQFKSFIPARPVHS
ncbi:MAG TPA: ATP-binding protein [Coleofasciculaceae cyanobacterium]|jgi:hypothetical protein